jgi:hypothetical protein
VATHLKHLDLNTRKEIKLNEKTLKKTLKPSKGTAKRVSFTSDRGLVI